jgi:CheY-like chemotaxis protein
MKDWDSEVTAEGYRWSRDEGASPRQRKKVLLVNDSDTVLMMERMVLSQAPYDLLTARDGNEAIETTRRERPDLILLDVMMPRMNGFATCRALRQVDADVPILIAISRSAGDPVEVGCTDFVDKPIHAPALLAKLKTLLGT